MRAPVRGGAQIGAETSSGYSDSSTRFAGTLTGPSGSGSPASLPARLDNEVTIGFTGVTCGLAKKGDGYIFGDYGADRNHVMRLIAALSRRFSAWKRDHWVGLAVASDTHRSKSRIFVTTCSYPVLAIPILIGPLIRIAMMLHFILTVCFSSVGPHSTNRM